MPTSGDVEQLRREVNDLRNALEKQIRSRKCLVRRVRSLIDKYQRSIDQFERMAEAISSGVASLKKTIDGNGKGSLPDRMRDAERDIEELEKDQVSGRDWLKWGLPLLLSAISICIASYVASKK